ncbi:MAG: TadE/TadG family type IV pilus assembly protein [Verrucomicrobiota bacterium]
MNPLDSARSTYRASRATLAKGLAIARRDHGVAAVEFAVLVPVLLLIVFGILDFGRAMNYKNELTQVANQVARYAAVNKSPIDGRSAFPSCGDVKSYFASSSPLHVDTPEIATMISNGTLAITPGAKVGDPVTVTFTTDFSYLPFIGSSTFGIGKASSSLSGKATMRLEQVPTFGGGSC